MYRQLLVVLSAIVMVGCTSTVPSDAGTEAPVADSPSATATANPSMTATPLQAAASLDYRQQKLPRATAHILRVPTADQYMVKPAVAEALQPVAEFATSNQAIAAINGGFFDPENQKTTSYVTLNRAVVADPKQNDQLTENPNLKIYLRQIFDRSEFRRYDCGGQTSYGIERRSQPAPAGCQVVDAIGGGPQLLPSIQSQREAFIDPGLGRDAIGTKIPNARSAIGITGDNQVLLVLIAQDQPGTGMTIAELAELMQSLGAETAMNLDGGSSSALFYNNQRIFGKLDESGQPMAQPVKSAIVVERQ